MAPGVPKNPNTFKFQSIPEGSPDIEKEDYKPKLLHGDSNNDLENNRSDAYLVQEETKTNPIKSIMQRFSGSKPAVEP